MSSKSGRETVRPINVDQDACVRRRCVSGEPFETVRALSDELMGGTREGERK